MTQTHPSHTLEGQESGDRPVAHAGAEHRTHQMQEHNHRNIFAVVGDEVDNTESATDALYRVSNGHARRAPATQDTNEGLREVQQRLDDMEDLAAELVQKSTEHRVSDFRDRLPIFSNIRSHKLATREGEIIQQMKDDLVGLKLSIAASGVRIDTTELEEMVNALSVPGGITKALATLLPNIRTFHRSVVVPRFEKVKMTAGNLKRQARDARNSNRMAA